MLISPFAILFLVLVIVTVAIAIRLVVLWRRIRQHDPYR
jgi:hypothetical protein